MTDPSPQANHSASAGLPAAVDQPVAIVVGAGLAGITAALHLAERGLPVLVLEADPKYPGGRVSSKDPVVIDGWTFPGEHGMHGIWSPYLNLQAMLSRCRTRPVFVPAQEEDWLYRRGSKIKKSAVGSAIRTSWIPAPFHYLNLFFRRGFLATLTLEDWAGLFPVWYSLLFAVGIDPLREDQSLGGLHLSGLLRSWSPALRAFMIGLTRSGLAAQPEEVPLTGFIAFLRFYTVLRRDAWAFSYLPQDGGTCLIDPLVQRLRALNGQLHMGVRVTEICRAPGGWEVRWQSSTDPQVTGSAAAEHLVMATDAPNTTTILRASQPTTEIAAGLELPLGTETAVVRLWFDAQPQQTSEAGIFSGDFTVDNFFWLDQIYTPYIRWRKATGGSAIEVHIYGPPAVLAEPDAVLMARSISDVQAAFPELRGHRIYQAIQRNPATHTLFGVGPADKHLAVQTPWPNLFCCGDWVRHPNPALFLERACVTGIAAANAVLQARGLAPWPLLDYPKPEPFVGWIEKLMVSGRQARKKRQQKQG